MLVPYQYQETLAARHKRFVLQRKTKASVLNRRVLDFIEGVKKSSFKESEKNEILACLNLKPDKP